MAHKGGEDSRLAQRCGKQRVPSIRGLLGLSKFSGRRGVVYGHAYPDARGYRRPLRYRLPLAGRCIDPQPLIWNAEGQNGISNLAGTLIHHEVVDGPKSIAIAVVNRGALDLVGCDQLRGLLGSWLTGRGYGVGQFWRFPANCRFRAAAKSKSDTYTFRDPKCADCRQLPSKSENRNGTQYQDYLDPVPPAARHPNSPLERAFAQFGAAIAARNGIEQESRRSTAI